MSMFDSRQIVEMFHLVFLRALVAKGEDKRLFALKGGCNLRFYFGSVRFSEDIDLDAGMIARDTLQRRVDRLLLSPVVAHPLRAHGIELVDISAPKQTDTAQRWKAGLSMKGRSVPLRTKIEFSRRDAIDGAAFESVDAALARMYALPPFLAPHYSSEKAAIQKIQALAGPSLPQARDVFDLNLLLARPATLVLPEDVRASLPMALDRAMCVGFDDYASAVVAFLEPDQAELYRESAAWDAMQAHVVERLGRLAS